MHEKYQYNRLDATHSLPQIWDDFLIIHKFSKQLLAFCHILNIRMQFAITARQTTIDFTLNSKRFTLFT